MADALTILASEERSVSEKLETNLAQGKSLQERLSLIRELRGKIEAGANEPRQSKRNRQLVAPNGIPSGDKIPSSIAILDYVRDHPDCSSGEIVHGIVSRIKTKSKHPDQMLYSVIRQFVHQNKLVRNPRTMTLNLPTSSRESPENNGIAYNSPTEAVQGLLASHPNGLAAKQIIKSLEQKIKTNSNKPSRILYAVLNTLKRKGSVVRDETTKRWKLIAWSG